MNLIRIKVTACVHQGPGLIHQVMWSMEQGDNNILGQYIWLCDLWNRVTTAFYILGLHRISAQTVWQPSLIDDDVTGDGHTRFSDESWFFCFVIQMAEWMCVYRHRVECYVPCCIQEVDRFGSGSVMMWPVISLTEWTQCMYMAIAQRYQDLGYTSYALCRTSMPFISMIMPASTQQGSLAAG